MSMQQLLQQNIIRITLHARKCKTRAFVTPDQLGIQAKTTDSEAFMSDYLEAGSFLFFPKSILSRTEAASKKVRQYLKRKALESGVNGYFVNMDDYNDIKEKFLVAEKEFMAIKDELIAQHNTYQKFFKDKMAQFLTERGVDLKHLETIVNEFPSKEMIEASFYFELSACPYPVFDTSLTCSNKALVSDLLKDAEKEAVSLYKNMLTTLYGEAFQKIDTAIDQFYENRKISSRTKTGLSNYLKKATKNNEWLGSTEINTLTKMIKQLFIMGQSLTLDEYDNPIVLDEGAALEQMEWLLGYIYNRCVLLKTDDALPYSRDYTPNILEQIYKADPLDETFVEKEIKA